jgi:histidine phosphotransferase ChpT
MGINTANLAAMIGSRICHDLISPIGAINNGLELLEMAGSMSGPELGLIADSVENADARIRFFRIAFGASGDQVLSAAEIRLVLADLSKAGRTEYHWRPEAGCPRGAVRLAFLAIMCCETAMPYGGTIHVDTTGRNWSVKGVTAETKLDADLWNTLSDPTSCCDITPALVQFALLPALALEDDRRIKVTATPDTVELRF